MNIGYLSECARDYAAELRTVTTLEHLYTFADKWKEIAPDAYNTIHKIDSVTFYEFIVGVRKEIRNRVHGAGPEWQEKYAEIVLPEILFRVAMIAERFKVPWGVAFIRCKDEGFIVEQDGIYFWKEEK